VDFINHPTEWYKEDGTFMLERFNSGCSYQGNGIIEFFDGKILVAEGEQYEKYPLVSKSSNDDKENILNDYIERASEYGFIFKNDEQYGKIVKVELSGYLPHEYGAGVTPLDVPEGKMWTPLYYEQIKGKKYSDFLDIFYKTRSGYTYNDYYRFELKKENFVSCKLSKQNNKAFVRKDQVAVSITSYSRTYSTYFFYCLEEDIN